MVINGVFMVLYHIIAIIPEVSMVVSQSLFCCGTLGGLCVLSLLLLLSLLLVLSLLLLIGFPTYEEHHAQSLCLSVLC